MGSTKTFDKYNMFIVYDGLIKNYQLTLLEILRSDVMREKYNEELDIDILLSMNKAQLEGLCIKSAYENVLKTIAKKRDYDYDTLLYNLSVSFPDIYEESELLPLGKSVQLLMRQSFMNNLYIYSPEYDLRIHNDLRKIYNSSQVIYVYGDFIETLNSIKEKINCFAITNTDYIEKIGETGKLSFSELIIANYGYNYNMTDDGVTSLRLQMLNELQEKYIFKYVFHNPLPEFAIPME